MDIALLDSFPTRLPSNCKKQQNIFYESCMDGNLKDAYSIITLM